MQSDFFSIYLHGEKFFYLFLQSEIFLGLMLRSDFFSRSELKRNILSLLIFKQLNDIHLFLIAFNEATNFFVMCS